MTRPGSAPLPPGVRDALAALDCRSRRLIGIAGPPGSGKSTLAQAVVDHLLSLGVAAQLLPMDGYHRSDAWIRSHTPDAFKGAPETFDADGFVAALTAVRDGVAVRWPLYQRSAADPQATRIPVDATVGCAVVEGNYLDLDVVPWSRVPAILDHLWMLRCPDALLRPRLLARQRAGGRSRGEAQRHVDHGDLANARLVRERLAVEPDLPGLVGPSSLAALTGGMSAAALAGLPSIVGAAADVAGRWPPKASPRSSTDSTSCRREAVSVGWWWTTADGVSRARHDALESASAEAPGAVRRG